MIPRSHSVGCRRCGRLEGRVRAPFVALPLEDRTAALRSPSPAGSPITPGPTQPTRNCRIGNRPCLEHPRSHFWPQYSPLIGLRPPVGKRKTSQHDVKDISQLPRDSQHKPTILCRSIALTKVDVLKGCPCACPRRPPKVPPTSPPPHSCLAPVEPLLASESHAPKTSQNPKALQGC